MWCTCGLLLVYMWCTCHGNIFQYFSLIFSPTFRIVLQFINLKKKNFARSYTVCIICAYSSICTLFQMFIDWCHFWIVFEGEFIPIVKNIIRSTFRHLCAFLLIFSNGCLRISFLNSFCCRLHSNSQKYD